MTGPSSPYLAGRDMRHCSACKYPSLSSWVSVCLTISQWCIAEVWGFNSYHDFLCCLLVHTARSKNDAAADSAASSVAAMLKDVSFMSMRALRRNEHRKDRRKCRQLGSINGMAKLSADRDPPYLTYCWSESVSHLSPALLSVGHPMVT